MTTKESVLCKPLLFTNGFFLFSKFDTPSAIQVLYKFWLYRNANTVFSKDQSIHRCLGVVRL